MPILTMNNVSRCYQNAQGQRVEALKGVNLTMKDGELLCILGPTGCGKTTLLRLAAGLETADTGSILVSGEPVDGIRPDVTLLFQQYSLFPWRTVLENVAFGMEMQGVDRTERESRARRFLALTKLEAFDQAYPHELSGGMQQRTALARALAYQPRLLLMDEPFGALDDRTRHRLQEELLILKAESRQSICFVTHSIDEAVYLADRIIVLRDSPGAIETEIAVDIPRPRDRRSSAFVSLHVEVWSILEQIIND